MSSYRFRTGADSYTDVEADSPEAAKEIMHDSSYPMVQYVGPTPVALYRVQVIASGDERWVGNGLSFTSIEAAKNYAIDLFMRWTSVRQWRVIDANGNEVARS